MNMDTYSSEICTTNVHQQTGALLVDVRERRDAQALAFDVPELLQIPFSELEQRWQELPQARELVLVCQNGDASHLASQFLQGKGFLNVSPMRGGILLWMQKGYPVIGKRFTSFDKEQEP